VNRKQRLVFISIGFTLIIALVAWQNRQSWFPKQGQSEHLPQGNYEPRFLKEGELWLLSAQGDTLRQIDIEIADKEDERSYGMMFRKSMDPNTGMLFIMPSEQRQSFYMKNTYVSLDILYITSTMEIIDIVAQAEPLNTRSLPSKAPAKYVLELKGGYCAQHGIKEGMSISYRKL